ncbi:MAG: DUF3667 domain-containing protein [Proteobacteria bacterium]|nr:DUF3667 domain-containing protein [Pseudomonadota bacterium]
MVTKQEPVPPPASSAACANCGAPLYGEYCYQCGQPVKGLIRHLSGVLGDVLDTLFNIDSRVLRTLPALYFRPGFLTREYFAGRRVRYVTPFRLMFFLALIAFFVMHLAFDSSGLRFDDSRAGGASFADAHTPAQVRAQEKDALAKLDHAETQPEMPPSAKAALVVARQRIQSAAADRLVELKRQGAPAAAGSATAVSSAPAAWTPEEADHSTDLNLPGGDTWELPRQQVHIHWLPGFANDWINQAGERMRDNLLALKHADTRNAAVQRMTAGVFSLLPQTMFVLLPLFAVILKVFFIFKRRLYMEHLIVALHSHAFIFLSLLVLFALAALKALIAPHAAWVGVPLGLAIAAAWIWLFVYLFLMQKRVYMQGWFFTTLKYGCIGICYTVLLSIAVAVAFVLSMASA